MALVKFVPDDTGPPGTGWFTNDQGRTIYTTDLEGARSVPPTPAPVDATPPGTRISYAGDSTSPYANAVASNTGATGSAAGGAPEAAVASLDKIGHTVAPAKPPGVTGAPAAAVASLDKIGHSSLPISRTTSTTVQGRSKASVDKQIGTDQAALDTYSNTLRSNASNADQRAQNSLDSQITGKTSLATQTKENAEQYATNQRAAEAEAQRYIDLPDGKLDPDRFVNELSTGSKIGLAVLAAISGFAQGMRNPNGPADLSVLNVLNRRVDQDIEAQKDQLSQGRIRKNNLIARALAKGADAKQAEAAARAQLWQLNADIGTLQAQKLGLQGAQLDAANNAIGAMQLQAQQHFGDLRAQTEARTQSTVEREVPKVKALTPEDALTLGKLHQQQLEDMDAAEVASVIAPKDADGKPRNLSVKRAGDIVKGAQDLAVKLPRVEVAENRIRQGLKALGVPPEAYDPESGTIDWTKADGLKGAGPLDSRPSLKAGPAAPIAKAANALGLIRTDYDNARDALAGIQEDITYATTGATGTKEQQETFRAQAGLSLENENAVKQNLSRSAQSLATNKRSLLSGDAEATKLYQHNLNRGNGATDSLKPGVN